MPLARRADVYIDFINRALEAAGVTGLQAERRADGGLLLDGGPEMTAGEMVDKLLNGLVFLHAVLLTRPTREIPARDAAAPIDLDAPGRINRGW